MPKGPRDAVPPQGRARLLWALLLCALLAGCTSTVRGTASPAATSDPQVSGPGSSAPPEPPIEVTPAPEPSVGTAVEAHRIAAVTALVPVTFPERSEGCAPYGPFSTAADLEASYFTEGTAADILDRWGFVTGWGQCNAVPGGGPATTTLAMELSDPESAVRAADELAAGQAFDGYAPARLPGLDAAALLSTVGDEDRVQVFLPVGRMLAYSFHVADAGQGLADAARLMTDQVGLLESFQPTPQADVPTLPTDPQGLRQFVLQPPGQLTDVSGPYDLEGYLRLAIDPFRERDLLTANGFMGFYTLWTDEGDLSYAVALYAFPATAQTNAVYNGFAELETAAFGGTAFDLPAIPDAPCFFASNDGDGTYYQRCYVGFGRYLASVDVSGLAAPDDVARMNELLPAQRDLING